MSDNRKLALRDKGTEAEWTCGHVGGAMCQECYRQLAAEANKLAVENMHLREENQRLLAQLNRANH